VVAVVLVVRQLVVTLVVGVEQLGVLGLLF
jgi:hypothetical protein